MSRLSLFDILAPVRRWLAAFGNGVFVFRFIYTSEDAVLVLQLFVPHPEDLLDLATEGLVWGSGLDSWY